MSERPTWRSGRPNGVATAALDRRIVTTATRLFLENGYAATSMTQLAVAAGASKQTIYRRYPSKEQCFAEIVEELARASKEYDSLFHQNGADSLAALRETCRTALELASTPWSMDLYRILIAERARFPDLFDRVLLAAINPVNDIILRQIEIACAGGQLRRDLKVEILSQFLIGVTTAWLVQDRLLGGTRLSTQQERADYIDCAWDLFLHGAAQ